MRQETLQHILEEVATTTATDLIDLPPLGESLDTDALGNVLETPKPVTVQFEYAGCDVTVRSGDGVQVSARPALQPV